MTAPNETVDAASINPRDISYAMSAKTRLGQMTVRIVENLTGRLPSLLKIYGYDQDIANGENFWDCVWRRLKLSVTFLGEPIEVIPETGPVVIVANHPYGILDAAVVGWLLSRRRKDFKIVANSLFQKAPELAPNILPVDFDETREAQLRNLQMRRDALSFIAEGGAVAIFPAGAIASAQTAFGYPYDPEWKSFTAKLIAAENVTVIPLPFPGRNTVFFEAASRISQNLRYGLNFFEFRRRARKPLEIVLGKPINPTELQARKGNPAALMQWLRGETYALGRELPYGERYGDDPPPLGRRWG